MQLSKKLNDFFVNFLLHFWNLHLILIILKKRMSPMAYVFSEMIEGERSDYVNV